MQSGWEMHKEKIGIDNRRGTQKHTHVNNTAHFTTESTLVSDSEKNSISTIEILLLVLSKMSIDIWVWEVNKMHCNCITNSEYSKLLNWFNILRISLSTFDIT